MRIRYFIFVLHFFTLWFGYNLLTPKMQEAVSDETVEFDVSASCEPHAEVIGPSQLRVLFSQKSRRSGPPVFYALMTHFEDSNLFEIEAKTSQLDYPDSGWISAIFEGPPVKNYTYCQPDDSFKKLHFSYYPQQNFKIALSPNGMLSHQEIDQIHSKGNGYLTVQQSGRYQNEFHAGEGTDNLYWLQFSIRIHQTTTFSTSINFDFL